MMRNKILGSQKLIINNNTNYPQTILISKQNSNQDYDIIKINLEGSRARGDYLSNIG